MRVLVVTALVACSSDHGGVTYIAPDRGTACLHAADPLSTGAQAFQPGSPVVVSLEVTCFDGCDIDRSASCSVGSDLVIQSTAMWTDETASVVARGSRCTKECGILTASCASDPLSAGTYMFTFAGTMLSVQIPSQVPEPPCIQTPPAN